MKALLTLAFLLFSLHAMCQSYEPLPSQSKHFERIRTITRIQASALQLNEQDIILLSKTNQRTLPLIFEAQSEAEMIALYSVYQVRLSYILKPEQVAHLNANLEVINQEN